MVGTYF
ncbi:Protein CBG26307 [Caenorhabditis briggsae]|nr:Protein CBG26307 [Caenorhabditis briggsae]CAR98910.1 Protein CBG26307 [Caenorhabditis briggsae]